MGCCWAGSRSNNQLQFSMQPYKPAPYVESKMEKIKIDETSSLINSYEYMDHNVFKKRIYDWKSLPIITFFQFENKTTFEIRNKGIKANNFVVGIIKKSAINLQISLPWKTHYCICFESHEGSNQSGIIYQGKLIRTGQAIKQGETIKVIVGPEDIEWRVYKKTICTFKIPSGFRNDEIFPYVALFNPGDSIQFINQIEFAGRNNLN